MNSKFDVAKNRFLIKDAGYLFLIFTIGVIFSLHGYFDYGDIGAAFLANDMMLLKAKDAGASFVELIKQLPPGYNATFHQHTYNYSLSVAAVNAVSRIFGFSPNNIAYVSLAVYFTTLLVSYYLGRLFAGREFGFLFSLLLAVSQFFNVATRTGSGIFYFTHILYASCLIFFIQAHVIERSMSKRIILILLTAWVIAIALFNGYPLSFITLPIIVVFFVLFVLGRCFAERFFQNDEFLSQYRVQSVWLYLLLALTSAVLYCGVSLGWDMYTGAEPFTTYKGTIQGTLGRASPYSISLHEYLHRAANIFNFLFIDMDKNGYFAGGGTHSDTAFPGQPVLPFSLLPFFLFGLFNALRRPNFVRLLFAALFGMFVYVLVFHFQGYGTRVWFPMTFFVVLISADGIQQCVHLLKERYHASVGMIVGACLLTFIVYTGYRDMLYFVNERGGNKIFMSGQREVLHYIQNKKLGRKNLVIYLADEGKTAWISNVYFNNKNKVDTIIGYGKQEALFSGENVAKLRSEYDSVYVVAPPPVYLMDKFGFNAAGPGPNYENFIVLKFPTWMPEKVVYSEKMRPLHYILNLKDLLQNGVLKFDFKKDNNTLTYHNPRWNSQRYINGKVVSRSKESPHDGNYFLAISGDKGSSLSYTFGYPFCKMLYGHNLEFTAWIKAGIPGATMVLDLLYLDGSTERVPSFIAPDRIPFHPGDGQWHQVKLQKNFDREPIVASLTIFNSGSGKDEINVDQITVRKDGEDISSYIPDNGFETFQESELVDSPSGKYQFLTVGQGSIKESVAPLKQINLLGPVKNLSYFQQGREANIPIGLSENMSAVFSPKKSEVVFYPFSNNETANVSDIKSVVKNIPPKNYDPNDPVATYYELKAEDSHVVFSFTFPFAIKQADIISNPVIFNDRDGQNSYGISYSTDGKKFTEVLHIQSNANERYGVRSLPGPGGDMKEAGGPEYNGFGEYTTYEIIKPNTKTVYIKLAFHNKFHGTKNSRLYYKSFSTMFKFLLDTDLFFQEHPLADTIKVEAEESKEATAFLVYDMEKFAIP